MQANGSQVTSASDLPLVLDAEQARHLLGVGRDAIYELARTGRIPSFRLGRHLRFSRDALLRLVDGSCGQNEAPPWQATQGGAEDGPEEGWRGGKPHLLRRS